MSKRPVKVQDNKPILTKEGIGFEWDVTPNYFNKNNCDSDDSDKVSRDMLMFKIKFYD